MKRQTAAFTLVELLAVLAILAILTSLLLAAVEEVRAHGQATQCTSNLRQLVLANLNFAGEHEGQFAPAQDETNDVRWHGVRDPATGKFQPGQGPLSPYLGASGQVKLCPSLRQVLTGAESFEDGTGGYGYNAAYIGGTPMNMFQAEHMALVAQPAHTVMFTDVAFPRATGLQEYAYCEPWQYEYPLTVFRGRLSASVHFRHSGKANVAWCDGHVTAEAPSQLDKINGYGGNGEKWKIGWFGPSLANGYWRPY